jgi:tight adherence protein C
MHFFLDPIFLSSLLVFVVLVGVFFILQKTLLNKDLQRRTKSFKEGSFSKEQHKKSSQVKSSDIVQEKIKEYLIYVSNINKGMASSMRTSFEQCGFSPQKAAFLTPLFRIMFTVLFGSVYFVLNASFSQLRDKPNVVKYIVFFALVFIGARFFDYFLDIIKSNRYAQLKKNIPNAIDLLVSCSRGGLNMERSFERLSQELSLTSPDLARECALTGAELSILPERRLAYENLMRRIELPLIKALCVSLIQADEQGVSVGQTLQVLSQEFTKEKLLEIEERAARVPALLSIPIIFFSLPSLVIIILGPAISQIAQTAFLN